MVSETRAALKTRHLHKVLFGVSSLRIALVLEAASEICEEDGKDLPEKLACSRKAGYIYNVLFRIGKVKSQR